MFPMNKVAEQTKMLLRDWRLIDSWDLQVFLRPLEQVVILISEPQALQVIFENLSEQVKHFTKRIIKDDQKIINAVLLISSLLSFESKSLQLLLSLSESATDLLSFPSEYALISF